MLFDGKLNETGMENSCEQAFAIIHFSHRFCLFYCFCKVSVHSGLFEIFSSKVCYNNTSCWYKSKVGCLGMVNG